MRISSLFRKPEEPVDSVQVDQQIEQERARLNRSEKRGRDLIETLDSSYAKMDETLHKTRKKVK